MLTCGSAVTRGSLLSSSQLVAYRVCFRSYEKYSVALVSPFGMQHISEPLVFLAEDLVHPVVEPSSSVRESSCSLIVILCNLYIGLQDVTEQSVSWLSLLFVEYFQFAQVYAEREGNLSFQNCIKTKIRLSLFEACWSDNSTDTSKSHLIILDGNFTAP
jgi:hypothetical protein